MPNLALICDERDYSAQCGDKKREETKHAEKYSMKELAICLQVGGDKKSNKRTVNASKYKIQHKELATLRTTWNKESYRQNVAGNGSNQATATDKKVKAIKE